MPCKWFKHSDTPWGTPPLWTPWGMGGAQSTAGYYPSGRPKFCRLLSHKHGWRRLGVRGGRFWRCIVADYELSAGELQRARRYIHHP